MHILSPTILQKKKLKDMIHKLFPQYNYIRINSNGNISLSKSFWHKLLGIVKHVHIIEMCTVFIPERLEKLESRIVDEYDNLYEQTTNKYSQTVLELLHNRSNSIIDYLYDEYTYVKYGIHKIYYTVNHKLPETTYTLSELLLNPIRKDSIVLSHLSNVYIKEALKRWKNANFVLNHPMLRSRYLDLWFKREIKQKLNEIYNIQIVLK